MISAAEKANIALRNEANDLIALIGEKPEHFWRCLEEAAHAKRAGLTTAELRKVAEQTASKPATPRKPGSVTIELGDPRHDKAMDLIEQIEELVDQVPSRGQEFAESVAERTKGIAFTIETCGFATPAQVEALENMRDGLARWIH